MESGGSRRLCIRFHFGRSFGAEVLSEGLYGIACYVVLVLSSLVEGMLVSVVLMLYGTARDLIEVVGLERKGRPILSPETGYLEADSSDTNTSDGNAFEEGD